jgi:hypothetical protein
MSNSCISVVCRSRCLAVISDQSLPHRDWRKLPKTLVELVSGLSQVQPTKWQYNNNDMNRLHPQNYVLNFCTMRKPCFMSVCKIRGTGSDEPGLCILGRVAFLLPIALVNVATPGSPRWLCGTVLNTDHDLWEIGTLEKRGQCVH